MSDKAAGEPALRVVLCSAPADKAEGIARAVLEKRLAACVNIVPGVVSLYWWEGAIARDAESLLVIKTRAELLPALTEAIKGVHPHEVPEVIAVAVAGGEGNEAYRGWVVKETGGA